MTGEDAIEFMMAGATCISVGSANLVDPKASMRILEEIKSFMQSHQIEDISSIINSVMMN